MVKRGVSHRLTGFSQHMRATGDTIDLNPEVCDAVQRVPRSGFLSRRSASGGGVIRLRRRSSGACESFTATSGSKRSGAGMICARVARVSASRRVVSPEAAFDGVNRHDFFQRVIGNAPPGANVPDGVFCIHCRSVSENCWARRTATSVEIPPALSEALGSRVILGGQAVTAWRGELF